MGVKSNLEKSRLLDSVFGTENISRNGYEVCAEVPDNPRPATNQRTGNAQKHHRNPLPPWPLGKGVDSVFEIVGGILLTMPTKLARWVTLVSQHEVYRHHNVLAGKLDNLATSVAEKSSMLEAAYLVVHGGAKVALILAIVAGKRWGYTGLIGVLSLFTTIEPRRAILGPRAGHRNPWRTRTYSSSRSSTRSTASGIPARQTNFRHNDLPSTKPDNQVSYQKRECRHVPPNSQPQTANR